MEKNNSPQHQSALLTSEGVQNLGMLHSPLFPTNTMLQQNIYLKIKLLFWTFHIRTMEFCMSKNFREHFWVKLPLIILVHICHRNVTVLWCYWQMFNTLYNAHLEVLQKTEKGTKPMFASMHICSRAEEGNMEPFKHCWAATLTKP